MKYLNVFWIGLMVCYLIGSPSTVAGKIVEDVPITPGIVKATYNQYLGSYRYQVTQNIGEPYACTHLPSGNHGCFWTTFPRVLDGYFTDEVTVIFFDPYGKTCGWVINGTHGKVENIQCDMSIKK